MAVDGEMDSSIITPSAPSTVTDSDVKLPKAEGSEAGGSEAVGSEAAGSDVTLSQAAAQPPPAFYVLDISLISAQDLAPVSKSMRTYAIIWIHPSRKLTSRVDQQSHNSPLWNDRFAFKVDSEFLLSDHASVTVEIYAVSWFRDVLVGTVNALMSDLVTPSARNSTRYVALQVRRPSGNPQGLLNMGVALMDATDKSMPFLREMNPFIVDYQDPLARSANQTEKVGDFEYEEMVDQMNEKIHLWRSYSVGKNNEFNEEFPFKGGSVVNGSGSMCNGSELCSDVGPSASIVAGEIARKLLPPMAEKPQTRPNAKADDEDDMGSSIVEEMTIEEATAKGFNPNMGRLRKEISLPPKHEGKLDRSKSATGHSRRNSDGGLFSCFGNAYGFEITIVCGSSTHGNGNKVNIRKSNKSNSRRRFIGSETSSS